MTTALLITKAKRKRLRPAKPEPARGVVILTREEARAAGWNVAPLPDPVPGAGMADVHDDEQPIGLTRPLDE